MMGRGEDRPDARAALPFDDADGLSPAAELFARLAGFPRDVLEPERSAIEDLVAELGGSTLAIEHAARWFAAFDVRDAGGLRALKAMLSRDLFAALPALRTPVERLVERLTQDERRLLAVAAHLDRTFTAGTLERALRALPELGSITALLARLADEGLLARVHDRYRMPHLVRAFLRGDPTGGEAVRRFASDVRAEEMATAREGDARTPNELRIDLEECLAEAGQTISPALLLRLALRHDEILRGRGNGSVREQAATRALTTLERLGMPPSAQWVPLLAARADARRTLGLLRDAEEDLQLLEALAPGAARVVLTRGTLLHAQGRYRESAAAFSLAMTAAEANDPATRGDAEAFYGVALAALGDVETGRFHLLAALDLQRANGDVRGQALTTSNLALLTQEVGALDEARALYAEAMALHRRLGNRRFEHEIGGLLAILEWEDEATEAARSSFASALARQDQARNERAAAQLRAYAGRFHFEHGDHATARALLTESIRSLTAQRDVPHELVAMTALALVEAKDGRAELARSLATLAKARAAEGVPESTHLVVAIDAAHVAFLLARSPETTAAAHEALEAARNATTFAADVRLAARSLRRHLPMETSAPVGPHGFRRRDGRLADLGRRPVLRRLLAALSEAGERGADTFALVAKVWPGEKMSHGSARTRLYWAVSAIRRLDLEQTVEHDGEVYRLRSPR